MSYTLMHGMQPCATRHVVAPRAAWLVAVDAALWVTRSGDLDDHVLASGDRLAVQRGDDLVLESLSLDRPVAWRWQAAAQSHYGWRRALLAPVFGFAARVLRGAAEGLAALARSAAAIASRAHGCINAGDSRASAGTVQ